MDKKKIIESTAAHVREKLSGEETGHDWWHSERVRKTALHIAKEEGADTFIVELAALLHDIADYKFNSMDDSAGPKAAREILQTLGADEGTISHVCEIIETISFKGAGSESKIKTKEAMAVQDADRLDAMGAIGIARTFATGAKLKRPIHNPEIKPMLHKNAQEYKDNAARGGSINHFHEKLLHLKDRMETETGRKMAEHRHEFMEQYLEEFYNEWEGKI
ncbi:HD domain-containing protein [Candidatus Woesearchaeota archaeon]|nr:HD domain-containing protein [Candidatus Woesearchaeota archaeon]